MNTSNPAPHTAVNDSFFPSGFFAKVPAECLSPLGSHGANALSHAEFRLFVALCRFRGPLRKVNPTRATLAKMTGLSPNNISRASKALQAKGWLLVHYLNGREIANYELKHPVASKKTKDDRRPDNPSPTPEVSTPSYGDEYYTCEDDMNSLTMEQLEEMLTRES